MFLIYGGLRGIHVLIHLFIFLIEHFFDLVHKIFSIDGHEIGDLLHEVDDEGEGKALPIDYPLLIGRLHVLQFLEGLIVGIAEIEVYPSLFLLLGSIDLDIRQHVRERRVAELRPFFLLR